MTDPWKRKEGYGAYDVDAVLISSERPLTIQKIEAAIRLNRPKYNGYKGHLDKLINQGLVERNNNLYKVTDFGRRVWDGLADCPD